MRKGLIAAIVGLMALIAPSAYAETAWINDTPQRGGVTLVGTKPADIVYSQGDPGVVAIAAEDLSEDIERVTGQRPLVGHSSTNPQQVWIGTLGQNPDIDALIAKKRINATALKDCWECYLIVTVPKPKPGVDAALIIIGSDRRGAAYGVYEVSEAIGVSPWYWWADVAPKRKDALYVAPLKHKFGPPSVKYRGIFINDEDWGLFPWAAQTFDPETGNIGPKTYERVFELLLRLKANTLWPAMHKVSTPFNANPDNAALADRYAIVMGSSHAEPMLRNNVGEWREAGDRFNYVTNAEGVQAYWRERLKTNSQFESHYTLGMRGIHDSGIVGVSSMPEKQALLNRIIADQRSLLKTEVGAPETLPQMFVPYKEVLEIYRAGIDLPEDVTLVWPDDNFGYIRQFPNAEERKRSGGSGVYYHLSYLGAPLSYLWLSTTPVSLIREEMTRAYDHGADRLWIVNIGDIKPSEIGLTYFLDLAWDVKTVRKLSQTQYLERFARKTFGTDQAPAIAAILDQHFRVNFERRPEHLQYFLPGEKPRRSGLPAAEVAVRLSRFDPNVTALAAIKTALPPEQADGFFQLVDYPVRSAALANQRFFALEAYASTYEADPHRGMTYAAHARASDEALTALTAAYGDANGGKWRHFIAEEPADNLWTSYRQTKPAIPAAGLSKAGEGPAPRLTDPTIRLESTAAKQWSWVEGLGRGEGAARALTTDATQTLEANLPNGGTWRLSVHILPTYPTDGASAWRLKVQIDGGPVQEIVFDRAGQNPVWAQGVLNNRLSESLNLKLSAGRHTIKIISPQADLILDGVDLYPSAK